MSFYLHQVNLAQHIDGLEAQIRQVRLLQEMMYQLNEGAESEGKVLIYRNLERLDALETGLRKLVRVLEEHSNEINLYFHQLDNELESMTYHIDRLFE